MTSTNINKIVRSNLQLKPWMLSKNSSEIIDDYIKNMYKQMPNKFKHALKKIKIASPREENMGPIKQYLSQNTPVAPKIVAVMPKIHSAAFRATDAEKNSPPKSKNPILKALTPYIPLSEKTEGNAQLKKHTATAANLGSRKKLLSPMYKVHSSRRYGSSASSSRSSLYGRRHDDRHAYHYRMSVLNNLSMRYYNTNLTNIGFDRHLYPTRNQKLHNTLGSIPDAMQVSSAIVNGLMVLDDVTLKRLSVNEDKVKIRKKETATLKKENLHDFYNDDLHETTIKKNQVLPKSWPKDSLENRGSRNQINVVNILRQSKPPQELFTLQHDRYKTELHEKHRRNRMKKLGLIERSPSPAPPPPAAHNKVPKTDEKANVEQHGEPFNQVVMNTKPEKKAQTQKQVSETLKTIKPHWPTKSQDTNAIKRKWQQNDIDLTSNASSTDQPIMTKRRIIAPSNKKSNLEQNYYSVKNTNAPTDQLSAKQPAVEGNKPQSNSSEVSNSPNYVNVNKTDSPTASLTAIINANSRTNNYSAYRYNHSHYFSK